MLIYSITTFYSKLFETNRYNVLYFKMVVDLTNYGHSDINLITTITNLDSWRCSKLQSKTKERNNKGMG